jgi:hypothetical protein
MRANKQILESYGLARARAECLTDALKHGQRLSENAIVF